MGIINVNKQISRDRIDCDGTVKVTLSLTAEPGAQEGGRDIVLVLDRSGGMAGEPFSAEKAGVQAFLDSISGKAGGGMPGGFGPKTRAGLVSFADSASVNVPLGAPVGQIREAVSGLAPGGRPNAAEAVRAAARMLEEDTGAERMILLLTDGETDWKAQTDSAAAAARESGITIYCIGIGSPSGIREENLASWASGPSVSHLILIRELGEAARIMGRLLENGEKNGATEIVIDETINSDFAITSLLTPTKGTASMVNTVRLTWKIDSLGLTENEGAVLEFYIRHTAGTAGTKRVNQSICYSDAEGNTVIFPNPCVSVECGELVMPERCLEPTEISMEGCQDTALIDMGEIRQEGVGRIVEVSATLRHVCPGRRTAMAVILTEKDTDGNEHPRGMKVFTVPAHHYGECRDIRVRGIKFVLPEDLEECRCAPGSMCRERKLSARVIAHRIDHDYQCLEGGEQPERRREGK